MKTSLKNQHFQIYFILHDSYAKFIAEFEYGIFKILNVVLFVLFNISQAMVSDNFQKKSRKFSKTFLVFF